MNQYDQFKEKLHDYKVNIDKEKLWQQTSHAIPQRRRRRMMLFVLLGSLGMASVWLVYNENDATPNHVIASMQKNIQPVAEQAAMVIAETPKPETTGTGPDINGKPQKTNSVAHDQAQVSMPSLRNNQAGKNTPMRTGHDGQVLTKHANSSEIRAVLTNAPVQRISEGQIQLSPGTVKEITYPGEVLQSPRAGNDDEEMQTLITAQSGLHVAGSTGKDETPLAVPEPARRSVVPSVAPLPGLQEATHTELTMDIEASSVPVIPAGEKQRVITFSTLATAGISSFTIRPLDEASEEVAQLLSGHVRGLEHLSVDMTGSLPWTDRLSVEASVGWKRWTTETRQQITTTTPFTREGVTTIRVDEQGVAHPVHGLVEGVQLSHYQLRRYTQYHTVDGTVSLRLSLLRARRLMLDAVATGGLVLFNQVSGSTLNAEGVMWKFSSEENPFTRKSTLIAGGGVQIEYYLTPHVRMSTMINHQPVRYTLSQVDQYTEWTHSTLRGNLGIRYQY